VAENNEMNVRRANLLVPPTPFQRMARTHGLMVAGDAVMMLALADSLFLSISPDAARGKVLLFLLVSFAPFTVISSLIGPTLDRMRGGRRLAIILVALGRIAVTALMIWYIDSLALFPLAFISLVLQKSYAISKSALVPLVVRNDTEFVEANSKLGLIAGISGALVVPIAFVFQWISAQLTLIFAVCVFAAALISAVKLPRDTVVAASDPVAAEVAALRSVHVVKAANAMGLLRASSGFLFFHLAFWLRGETAGAFWFGVGVMFSTLGTFAANAIGPYMRNRAREETMLLIASVLLAAMGILGALQAGPLWAVLLAASVSFATGTGRVAFEAVLQRDASEANRARTFARFETRFQLQWALAALVPVLIPLSGEIGFLAIAGMGVVAVLQLRGRHPDWTRGQMRQGRD
jgi:MFS family permease